MVIYTEYFNFGGLDLEVTSISPSRTIKTRKQVIGKTLSQVSILGMNKKQWVLEINGVITGSTSSERESKRELLESLDDTSPHELVDGHHDGVYYIVPESLNFDDNSDVVHGYYKYSVTLVEK